MPLVVVFADELEEIFASLQTAKCSRRRVLTPLPPFFPLSLLPPPFPLFPLTIPLPPHPPLPPLPLLLPSLPPPLPPPTPSRSSLVSSLPSLSLSRPPSLPSSLSSRCLSHEITGSNNAQIKKAPIEQWSESHLITLIDSLSPWPSCTVNWKNYTPTKQKRQHQGVQLPCGIIQSFDYTSGAFRDIRNNEIQRGMRAVTRN